MAAGPAIVNGLYPIQPCISCFFSCYAILVYAGKQYITM